MEAADENEHRLLDELWQNAALTQNETHTTLSFKRPLKMDGWYGVEPNALNTFIYAVGQSNEFGFHALDGSQSLTFSTDCPHGTLAPLTNTTLEASKKTTP